MLHATFDHADPHAMITITDSPTIAYAAQDALRRAGSLWPTVAQLPEPWAGHILALARDAHGIEPLEPRGDKVFTWLCIGLVHLT